MKSSPDSGRLHAFTLLELLVAITIFSIALGIIFSVIGQTTNIWRRSSSRIEEFQASRTGFDILTRNLSQASMNGYLDYDNVTNPQNYLRKSELAFCAGAAGSGVFPGTQNTGQALFFQAPLGYATNASSYGGMDALLNTCGYYISFTTNNTIPPHVATASNPWRFRLMQLLVPTENNTVYSAGTNAWFTAFTSQARPVADNVIALVVRLQDPSSTPPDINPDYTYDTTLNATNIPQPVTANQLPPMAQVTMVAIDENSAKRLDIGSGVPSVLDNALAGKFQSVTNFDSDLSDLKSKLAAAHILYRVFSSATPIRESKWTK